MSNKELAREIECFADRMAVAGKKSVPISIDFARLLVERLQLPTDEDIEAALKDQREKIRESNIERFNNSIQRLYDISQEIENLADEQKAEVEQSHLLITGDE